MWNRQHIWLHYVKNIMATDMPSALFLAMFLRKNKLDKSHAGVLEVIDLHRYKVIRQKNKVRAALNDAYNKPFVFFVGKN